MRITFRLLAIIAILLALAPAHSAAQTNYQVVAVQDGGTIRGTVKWQGAVPRLAVAGIYKDPFICDPQGLKRIDPRRLVVSPDRRVADTVVARPNITRGT